MYSSRALRMGSTDAIQNPGATFAAILNPGVWSSVGDRCYMGVQADEAAIVADLLIRPPRFRQRRPGPIG